MSNERKPLLSDKEMLEYIDYEPYSMQKAAERAAVTVREYYEALITSGNLRVVKEVHAVQKLSGLLCSNCSILWHNDSYCRGCGNKIKQ